MIFSGTCGNPGSSCRENVLIFYIQGWDRWEPYGRRAIGSRNGGLQRILIDMAMHGDKASRGGRKAGVAGLRAWLSQGNREC